MDVPDGGAVRRAGLGRGSATGPLSLLLVASVLIPAVLFGLASWVNYGDALASARQELVRTAEVAREQAGKVFAGQNQVLDRVNDLVRGMDADAVLQAGPALQGVLAAIIAQLPEAQAVLLADWTGRPLVSGGAHPLPPVNAPDSDDFRALAADRSTGPFVATLRMGDTGRPPSFGLARPWAGPGQQSPGVVAVAVAPGFFEDFYHALVDEGPEGGKGRVITLLRSDGTILARYPPLRTAAPPADVATRFLAAIRDHPAGGVYEGRSTVDPAGPVRIFAFSKVAGHPIYVVAGRSRGSVIAGWRRTMASHLTFGLPVTLALVAVSATALVRTRRERRALAFAQAEIERRERAEAALLRSQRLEAVGQMTGGVAHDFNNLLTVILGSAELLARRADDPARVRRLAEQIVLASRRGGAITQQLLTFSRRQFVSAEVVDVNTRITDFMPLLQRAASDAVTLRLDLEAGPHPVRLDPGHFEAALLNLVGNARDAIAGDGRVLITTRDVVLAAPDAAELPAGAYVRVSVADNGGGMDPQTAAKAFEPFFTTKGIGRGTGLGLSQVYGFAKQAGGDARIVTAPGQGSIVTLLLPRATRAAATAGGAVPPAQARPAGEVVILVVEDDPAVRETVVASLNELGYRTVTAGTAAEALERLGQGGVDLLFSDVLMPGGTDGPQLAIMARARQPGLRVLLTSGDSASFDREPAAGIPLLAKPYDQGQLAAQLRAALAP